MKISVITVCFNSESTIVDTLRSVDEQKYKDVEHIVIDGGSQDGTVKLVKSFGRPGIVVKSEPDQGIYDAMNKGLELATGDVIGFLNADDVYSGDDVLGRIATIMKIGGADALYGDVEFVHQSRLDKPVRRYKSDRFRPDRIAYGWMPAHPGLYLRRDIFERYGNFRKDYRIAGDFEFIARIFTTANLSYQYLPATLVRMRTGGVSTSGFRNTLLLNQEVLRACKENGIPTNWFKILSKYPLKLLEFVNK